MSKMERYISLLNEILAEINKEKNSLNSVWDRGILENFIESEIKELLCFAEKNEVYFKYGKSQRKLESAYIISDTHLPLNKTTLGEKIIELQLLYYKL